MLENGPDFTSQGEYEISEAIALLNHTEPARKLTALVVGTCRLLR